MSMKWLFDELSQNISKQTTRQYSTSFSMGIYFIHKSLREAIYAIYGFVRFADEIVDSFDGYDKKQLLEKFKQQTYQAVEDEISVHPILNSFQKAVHDYNIDLELVENFFQSMEMDLKRSNHTPQSFQTYIFGSAEVVGLMCLYVFVEGDKKRYEQLKPYAMKLGSAFQKVNFLRDIKSDYQQLGRTYFPQVDMENFSEQKKRAIEDEIEDDFEQALKGIKKLPGKVKFGVYLAYIFYISLFKKIKQLPARKILDERVRINNGKKVGLMVNGFIQQKFNRI